ncbi:MAG: hypothetical protein GTO54_12890 [Nitrososphaeria archaeon]|nr:hypothetical protein [Nitrososphaeria archaeon]
MSNEPKAMKEDKHASILVALDRLAAERNRFWGFVEKIQGSTTESAKGAGDPAHTPSLAEVLNGVAVDYINDITQSFGEIREELDRLLF